MSQDSSSPSIYWPRDQHRRFLFGYTAELHPTLDKTGTEPLAALAFLSRLSNTGVSYDNGVAQAELAEAAHNILRHHNRMATTGGAAVFGLIDAGDVDFIANLTAGVIKRWERACDIQGIESPFKDLVITDIVDDDFNRVDVQLIIETASAVIEVLQLGYWAKRGDAANRASCRFMGFVAQRGPNFAQAWLSGNLIRKHYHDRADDPTGALKLLTPSRLKNYALFNVRSPLDASIGFVERFNSTLAPSAVAAELGWTQEKVTATFTAEVRTRLAERWPSNPLIGVRRMAFHLDTTLTTESLARELAEDPDVVDILFTPRNRQDLACSVDPLAAARRKLANFRRLTTSYLAATTGWTRAEVDELFTLSCRRYLARSANLMQRVQAVAFAFKNALSQASIAQRLDWTERQAAALFTVSVRRKLAVGNTIDPLRRVEEIVQTRGDLIRDFPLPIEVINEISIRNTPKYARVVARKVAREAGRCPPGISPTIWLGIVARSPDAGRKAWLGRAALYNQRLKLTSLLRPSDPSYDASRSEPGYSINFTEQIFPDDPDDVLQELALKAGVSYQDVRLLLRAFTDDKATLSGRTLDILSRLREVAATR